MKKIIFVIIFICFALILRAQQDPQFSQNMFNILSVNPAYASAENDIVISAINRQQWVGFDNAPVTTVVNLSTPVQLGGTIHGLGLSVIRDELGFEKNTGVKFSYSYQKIIYNGTLHLGISIGFQNNALKGEWYVPDGDDYPTIQDDLGAAAIDEGKMVLDPGLGIFYKTDNFYAGVSVLHVTESSVSYSESVGTYLARHYYATAGYNFKLDNNWEVIPSFFYKTDAVVSQIDINSLLRYNKKIWGGVSYRVDDAIVGMIGVLFNNGIQIGYAYDISTSKIAKASHEFLLTYRFNTKLESRNQKYKSIRFL
jgi:type IX secretion system PorP/SprF family membrane protein